QETERLAIPLIADFRLHRVVVAVQGHTKVNSRRTTVRFKDFERMNRIFADRRRTEIRCHVILSLLSHPPPDEGQDIVETAEPYLGMERILSAGMAGPDIYQDLIEGAYFRLFVQTDTFLVR